MNILHSLTVFVQQTNQLLVRGMNPFALSVRVWVGLVFIKSGWLKLTSFENTLYLFREEYRVPLLPADVAAVAGTGSELVFGGLVIAGLCGRLSALGLFAVNAMAVMSYAHVLLAEGFEAALAQHYLWGFMLLVLAVYGPGMWSLDGAIARWLPRGSQLRPQVV